MRAQTTRLFNRRREVERAQRLLLRLHSPRLQMSLIVALTAGVGFLSSVVLLAVGMTAMWQRYPLAVAIAYAAFLFFLWCWLRWRKDDWSDSVDFSGSSGKGDGSHCAPAEKPMNLDNVDLPDVTGGIDGGEELVLVVIAIALLLAAASAAVWAIWAAPALFAEILVDAALARGLYRRIPGFQEHHWLQTATRRTALPFAVTAAILALAGAAMQHFVPTAKSIGQVFA